MSDSKQQIISQLVGRARLNRTYARRCRKEIPGSKIGEWHEGRSAAYMQSARLVKKEL